MAPPTLIGREHPAAVVHAELDRALDSHGGLMLVSGEPGIGKTSLARELADDARRRHAIVAVASSWAGNGAPDYWPWTQLLRGLERAATSQEWEEARGDASDALEPLLGHPSPAAALPRVAEDAAFRLADAATTLLVTLARRRPVVLLLDDLHWADVPSLDVLAFVARHTWFERLLIVGTYRDVEVEAGDHPLRMPIAELVGMATSVTLNGLDAQGVHALVQRVAGAEVDDAIAQDLHRRTGGNPFFVEQLTRLRTAGGDPDAIPSGIRETLEARLSGLPNKAYEILQLAAVIGREFDQSLLAAATGNTPEAVEAWISHALTARLVTKLTAGRFGFVHDLVREALAASITASDRRQLHAATVAGLEKLEANGRQSDAGALARHAYLAVPEVSAQVAGGYLRTAVEHACGRMAPEEATTHLKRAIELLDGASVHRRGELLLDLGAMERAAGVLDAARTTYRQALTLARELDAPRMFAEAALGLHAMGIPDSGSGTYDLELVDGAHNWLDDGDLDPCDPLAVKVLAATSRIRLHLGIERSEAVARSERALELARRCEDDEALGFSLLVRHDAIWEPGTAAERLALCDEIREVARRSGDDDLGLEASLLRMVALLEQGDPDAFAEHATLEANAERLRSPRFVYIARSRHGTLETLTGDFSAARKAIDDAHVLGEELGDVDRARLWGEQRWELALLEGDDAELDRLLDFHAVENVGYELPTLLTAGWRDDAAAVRRLASEVTTVADEYPGPFTAAKLCIRSEIAIASGDQMQLDDVRAQLWPLRDLWAVIAGGGSVYGPYAFWLARVDTAARRWDDAVTGFQGARDAAERLGARVWSVEAGARLAGVLLERDQGDDAMAASSLLGDVIDEARALGMHATVKRAERTAARIAPSEEAAQPTDDRQAVANGETEFRFDGHVWHLSFAGRTVQMPDAKGLRDLHALLGMPGQDVAVADLINPSGGKEVRTSARLGGDDVLDQRAKAEYRERLTYLGEEIDAALSRDEDDRAAQLDTEREALLAELRRATGLGGRPRRLGDDAERARKTVTARIRDTLRRLDERHPELAEHLRASVSTGVTCRYRPAREVHWRL